MFKSLLVEGIAYMSDGFKVVFRNVKLTSARKIDAKASGFFASGEAQGYVTDLLPPELHAWMRYHLLNYPTK